MDLSDKGCCRLCGKTIFPLYHDFSPTERNYSDQSRRRRSPRIASKSSSILNTELSSRNILCSDCMKDIHEVMKEDFDDEYNNNNDSNLKSPTVIDAVTTSIGNTNNSTQCRTGSISYPCDISPWNSTVEQRAISYGYDHTERMTSCNDDTACYRNDPLPSRIVSPESSKIEPSTCTKLCINCMMRTVPEEYMDYCKKCYALGAKDKEFKPSLQTPNIRNTGGCRLCSGKVNDANHQYCHKCYEAKQRDDAKRLKRELYQQQFKKKLVKEHVPYVCMDCGNPIHDCCWKTHCPPCLAKIRASKKGQPKLIKSPTVYKKNIVSKRRR